MTAFGPTDWDVSVLGRPLALDADPSGLSGALAVTAAAGVAAVGAGAEAVAAQHASILGRAGVVAVRAGGRAFEVRETLDGWEMTRAEVPTPDPGDLAVAAAIRAAGLTEGRRAAEGRP